MKKNYPFLILFIILSFFSIISYAQNGIINTIAGNGISGYTGDGGLALLAEISAPAGVCTDALGNIYISDNGYNVIRKISSTGIITTLAGNGTSGYSGDGGPATNARLNSPFGIAADGTGNIYFCDEFNNVIRKINTYGIITTVAGTGSAGYGGDGGPATSALLNFPIGLFIDQSGNMFISDMQNGVIRKINTSGIISTVAGSISVSGYSGDGGPATAAALYVPSSVAVDLLGNIFISDRGNNCIRKVNAAGIITTIAGTGIAGYSGDYGPATLAQLNMPYCVLTDLFGNVYISDFYSSRLRMVNTSGIITTIAGNGTTSYSGDGGLATLAGVSPSAILFDASGNLILGDESSRLRKIYNIPYATSDSFSVYVQKLCNGFQMNILAGSSATSLATYYGDGTTDVSSMVTLLSGKKSLNLLHSYANSGTYSIKHILRNGTLAIDSVQYTVEYKQCNTFPVKFYYDANSNCRKDSSEVFIYDPVTVEIDSNGVPLDTISGTSGIYYTAFGNPGDVYTFRAISIPPGLFISCPTSGIIQDTIQLLDNSAEKYFAFNCSTSTDFDLSINTRLICGRHWAGGMLLIDNSYCTPQTGTVTTTISPKYIFGSSYPVPTTIAGNTVTWDFSNISAVLPHPFINLTLSIPGPYLIPGDTAQNSYSVSPFVGDLNPANNNCNRYDTIKSSYDPNEMIVSPTGIIGAGTQLLYTIAFENTGNDTAHNIYIMDTLSAYTDPGSLRIIAASAPVMNVSMIKYGSQKIAKFDFPGISLLDSSHHNQCDGMVLFTINTRTGLPGGTAIFNHAGIFFDDNPVVMTDTVVNIVGTPTLGTLGQNAQNATIYPNPATDILTIKIAPNAYNTMAITNVTGQTILQLPLNEQANSIDIKSLPKGLYYVTLRGENGTKVQKLIKL